jgi:hypothetical protein
MADAIPFLLERPAEQVPAFKDVAADIVGAPKTPAQIVAEAPKPPSNDEVTAAQNKAREAREAATKSQSDFAGAMDTQFNAAKMAAANYEGVAQQGMQQIDRIQQALQDMTPAPSRGLRPFLASSEKDPPENTVAKLTQAITLMASMVGGGRAGARGALAGLTGALEGWRDGDRARGDREFMKWREETKALLARADREMQATEMWMGAAKIPAEQRMRMIDLSLRQFDNHALADKMKAGDMEMTAKELESQRAAAIDLQRWAAETEGKWALARETHELARQKQQENFQIQLQRMTEMHDRTQIMRQNQAPGGGLDPADLERLARERYNGAPWNEIVRGWGPRVVNQMDAINKRVTQMMAEAGDDATARMVRQRMLAADTKGAEGLTKLQSVWSSFDKEFEPAVANLLQLANSVDDRTGMPIMDKWLMRFRMGTGDTKVKALDQSMHDVAMLYARVVTRQGVTNMRMQEIAREKFNIAMTPEQLREVIDKSIRKDVEFARQGFEAAKQGLIQSMREGQKALTAPVAAPATAPPETKPTGKTRTLTVNGKQVTVTEE